MCLISWGREFQTEGAAQGQKELCPNVPKPWSAPLLSCLQLKILTVFVDVCIDLSPQVAPHSSVLPAALSLRQIPHQPLWGHQHLCACGAISFGGECMCMWCHFFWRWVYVHVVPFLLEMSVCACGVISFGGECTWACSKNSICKSVQHLAIVCSTSDSETSLGPSFVLVLMVWPL